MAMSDCEKCWDTPCACGWGYRDYSKQYRISLASKVLGVGMEALADKVIHIVPEEHPMKEGLDE